ncbi:nucleoside-diphosphate kinase [Candidatus Marinamargulisbacteria bacterium SCGC AG-343-K17]|nr:nucleoside-diphosphate kinase [Candidatus Marinamargulisbacteria bacterium SCGC AG-343-K17]
MVEQSLVFIKPDGVKRRLMAEIIGRFETRGFEFKRLELRQLSSDEVDAHYQEHVDKEFYPRLKEFILSGPILIMILEGDRVVETVRKMVGPTDALDADPGTIRGDLALSKGENVIHASDSAESAKREIENFFGSLVH